MSFDETFSTTGRQPIFSGGARQFDAILLRIVDGGLAGCIFLVPLLLGGRQALGHLVLVALAVVVAAAWVIRQCIARQGIWRRSAAGLVLVAAVVLLVIQMAPLPATWLQQVSPHTSEMLPLWSTADGQAGASGLGQWTQVSLTPAATQTSLVLFLAGVSSLMIWRGNRG